MQINSDPKLQAEAVAALAAEYHMAEQRPGIHQSELSYCLTKSFWERTDPEPPTEKEIGLFAVGFGLERVLFERDHETPLEVDGITLSLDSIKQFGGGIDLKTTRMRAKGRKGEDGFQWPDGWKRQMMAYCHALNRLARLAGEPECYSFGVVVVHLIEPEVTAWRVVFSPEELSDNWNWLLVRKHTLERMLATKSAEPFKWTESWECANCRYQLRCGLTASLEELTNA